MRIQVVRFSTAAADGSSSTIQLMRCVWGEAKIFIKKRRLETNFMLSFKKFLKTQMKHCLDKRLCHNHSSKPNFLLDSLFVPHHIIKIISKYCPCETGFNFVFFRDGCPVSRTNSNGRILDTLNIVRNGESETAVIGIKSHFFGSSTVTVATFEVNACVEANGANCDINVSYYKLDTCIFKIYFPVLGDSQ